MAVSSGVVIFLMVATTVAMVPSRKIPENPLIRSFERESNLNKYEVA